MREGRKKTSDNIEKGMKKADILVTQNDSLIIQYLIFGFIMYTVYII